MVHNDLSVQNNVEVDGPTRAAMEHAEAPTNPIMVQGDMGRWRIETFTCARCVRSSNADW